MIMVRLCRFSTVTSSRIIPRSGVSVVVKGTTIVPLQMHRENMLNAPSNAQAIFHFVGFKTADVPIEA
jgi:hypothetical protein